MRSFIIMAMFVSSLAIADWNGYQEVRDLEVEAGDASRFVIDAGPGSLTVQGVDNADSIRVTAEIGVDTRNDEKAAKFIEQHTTLTLERNGDSVRLVSDVDNGWGRGMDGWIKLVVEMPATLALDIDDGSGSIDLVDIAADG